VRLRFRRYLVEVSRDVNGEPKSLIGRQENPACDVIAEALHVPGWVSAADPGYTQADVGEFVQCRESPRGMRVPIVYHHEWRNGVGQGEAPERLRVDFGVMASEITDQEYKYPDRLDALTQIGKGGVGVVAAAESLKPEPGGLADCLGDDRRSLRHPS
jgi:hypothetical protein